ncbi:hypothetical protein U4Z34_23535, partial [Escherichia coli]|nr:hypothetical protein [Escherichia coli]
TSLKTSIKTITYLSDIGCLEIQGASLEGLIGAINQQRPSGADKKANEDFSKVIRKIDSLLKYGRLKFMMESC